MDLNQSGKKKVAERQGEKVSRKVGAAIHPQVLKLQKYATASFGGDIKDWMYVWNQFLM